MADRLRGDGAVLHARRAALRGPRRARRGSDRAARDRRRTRSRRSATSRASSSSPTTSRRPGLHPFHAPCGVLLRRGRHAAQPLRALRHLRRLPVPGAREVRRRGARRAAGARAPQRDAADATPRRCGSRRAPAARASPGSSSTATASAETFTGDLVVVVLRRGQQRAAAARLGERRASRRARERLRPGRPQLHVPQQPGGAGALEGGEPDGLPEDARAQRLLLRRAATSTIPLGQHPDGREVLGGDVPRREAAPDPARAGARRSSDVARHAVDFWLSTEDLPRPGEPRHAARRRRRSSSATRRPTSVPKQRLLHELKSHARAASACTTTTWCRATRTSRTTSRSRAARTRRARAGSATDPATSVLNTDCRAHEVDNLYVVDTSFFPSIGAVNPALTAMANALRVGRPPARADGARRPRAEPAHVA